MNITRKKKLLLKTHTRFDGSGSEFHHDAVVDRRDEGMHSQVVSVTLQQATPNSLVIQALIQQVCIHMEQDGKKRKLLYSAICRILNEHKFLGLDFSLDELWPLKQNLCIALSSFFRKVHMEVCSQVLEPCTSLSLCNNFDHVRTDYTNHQSRYQQSFEELETIARGGFGVVCKALNKIDGITYAVKKIKFMYTNDVEFAKVLREVRSFALLKHQNIVNYNNSWLETNIVTGSSVFRTDSDSESCSSDSEVQTTNKSLKIKRNSGSRAVSPVLNITETSVNSNANSGGQNSNLTSLLINSLNSSASFKSHSLVIDSEGQFIQQDIVIEENYQSTTVLLNASEKNIKQSNEIDESVDQSQKTPRRRRHSSGATCSAVDHSETENSKKDISNPRTYERGNSLDMAVRSVVPKKADTKWDISNLNVMAVLYIQMELCDQSLRDWLDEKAKDVASSCCEPAKILGEALKIFQQIVQGVAHIHSKSVIHRDLKPKNIFFCSDSSIKIGDFGLAAFCTQTGDSEFSHFRCSCSHTRGIGTAPYCAPEQRKNSSYDSKVDIYSLGIILIELLHNYRTRMEFCLTVDKMNEGSVPVEFVNVWPKEIVNLITKLINGNPEYRPEAEEVLDELEIYQVAEPLAISSSSHKVKKSMEKEAPEVTRLKVQISALEKQLLEKDEIIKDLQLKLLYSRNYDSFL